MSRRGDSGHECPKVNKILVIIVNPMKALKRTFSSLAPELTEERVSS